MALEQCLSLTAVVASLAAVGWIVEMKSRLGSHDWFLLGYKGRSMRVHGIREIATEGRPYDDAGSAGDGERQESCGTGRG